ncbi:MAG TPA: NUDIX domain-containing protein [Chitinophagaceae bacterium]|nr:NUDIX domain-containing protein [Chitinophagaceae bacterium]
MKKIIAAGGLVSNENNELLMIYRRGKWDLPKGKLDEGESIETCALREVKEETGLADITLQKFIGTTEHEYFDTYSNCDVVKETHWYAITAAPGQQLLPQTTEDIEEIEWVRKEILELYLNNTYPNIQDIIQRYLQE